MPYYNTGDYYGRGDYYQGDPGFFSFLGKAIGGIARHLPGVGAIVSAGAEFIPKLIHKRREQIASGELQPNIVGRALVRAEGPVGPVATPAEIGILAPGGGVTGAAIAPGPGFPMLPGPMMMGMHMRRTHPNRSTYVTRGGGTSRWPQTLTVHPKGTEQVTARRMNPGNARALRRSLRRVVGFAKLAARARKSVAHAAAAVGVHHRRGKKKR